jgi:hypothetical protein
MCGHGQAYTQTRFAWVEEEVVRLQWLDSYVREQMAACSRRFPQNAK